ncbi:DGQHR domain-containing protein [Pseudomonas sp.]|uniref:DGQHR domain-containing protein n=1 Tax=Pseudomonas sp. TaxID=306 RepID=UPI002634D72D|nr:DGQHR domain-containing protein [Pseudomonas sp.]
MTTQKKLILPALRGRIGDWIYYSCLMPIPELAQRVDYAKNIHSDKSLSKLIQRSLEGERAEHIASYLEKTEERFFNSLVLATYDGNPEWIDIGASSSSSDDTLLQDIGSEAFDTIGFLCLSGTEKIFAVDGQHRLAGIKRAMLDKAVFAGERLSVIFISHSEAERERTRRLFTTLNKTAKPVKKRDIIALDEDDTMAIVSRRLIEENDWFTPPKILVDASESIPVTNRVALTTISNLYDTLKIIFKHRSGYKNDENLRFYRPTELELEKYQAYAIRFFEAIAESFDPVNKLFSSSTPARVTQQYRGEHGGHLLFRPVGILAFATVAVRLSKSHDIPLHEAVTKLKCLPTDISAPPFAGVIWDNGRSKIIPTGKRLTTDILTYMAGIPMDTDKLKLAYSKAVGDDGSNELPPVLIE